MSDQSNSNSDSDEKSDHKPTGDYSKYVIVAENEFNTISTKVPFHNALWNIFETPSSRNRTPTPPRFRSQSRDSGASDTRVCCNYIFSTNTDFLAEILFVGAKDETLMKRKIFKAGTTTPSYDANSTSVVIRILEEKKKFEEKLSVQWAPDVTFVVNSVKCEANRQYLAFESPVFKTMLFGDFAEAKQSEIVLEGIGSADDFKDFLLAVSPLRVQPNPTNVLALLKLAHQYNVSSLMRKCEEHLKFCYEIPLIHRIFLAAKYDLNDLKAHTAVAMTNKCWKKMWKEHKKKLLEPELLYLHDIIADRLK